MKWYNFETMFRTLRDSLRQYLKDNNIKYEISECGCGWHFEIYANTQNANDINRFLDSQSFVNE